MKVAILFSKEDGSGSISVYEVDEDKFNEEIGVMNPVSMEDWYNVADWVEENGKLLYRVEPDYTISLEM